MKIIIAFLAIVTLVFSNGCDNSPTLPNLGNGYKFDRFKNTLQVENSENTVMVGSQILDYAFDSTFIIVSQRPFDSVPGYETMKYDDYWKVFENSSFKQYWIINKRQESQYRLDETSRTARYSNVHGPYKKQEYLQKREEFEVPEKLQLKKIDTE